MTEYIAAFAPENLPDIDYGFINADQMGFVARAMEKPENQENFEVTFLHLQTQEQREQVTMEWAAYKQAKGQLEARNRGAFAVVTTRDQTPFSYLEMIEGRLLSEIESFSPPFVTMAVAKVVKLRGEMSTYELFREYYESPHK